MKTRKHYLAALLAASGIALALPLAVHANPMTDGPRCEGHGAMGHGGHRGPGGEWGAFGGHGLRGLDLSEEQQDKIFNLRHAQEPAMRAKVKELREARSNLEALTRSSAYDEARVRALTDKAGTAMAELARMHARTEHQIYQLLTPEQRKELEERKDRHDEMGPGRPGMRHHGMRQG
jgi:periplasmic protein CpxP/Spy